MTPGSGLAMQMKGRVASTDPSPCPGPKMSQKGPQGGGNFHAQRGSRGSLPIRLQPLSATHGSDCHARPLADEPRLDCLTAPSLCSPAISQFFSHFLSLRFLIDSSEANARCLPFKHGTWSLDDYINMGTTTL